MDTVDISIMHTFTKKLFLNLTSFFVVWTAFFSQNLAYAIQVNQGQVSNGGSVGIVTIQPCNTSPSTPCTTTLLPIDTTDTGTTNQSITAYSKVLVYMTASFANYNPAYSTNTSPQTSTYLYFYCNSTSAPIQPISETPAYLPTQSGIILTGTQAQNYNPSTNPGAGTIQYPSPVNQNGDSNSDVKPSLGTSDTSGVLVRLPTNTPSSSGTNQVGTLTYPAAPSSANPFCIYDVPTAASANNLFPYIFHPKIIMINGNNPAQTTVSTVNILQDKLKLDIINKPTSTYYSGDVFSYKVAPTTKQSFYFVTYNPLSNASCGASTAQGSATLNLTFLSSDTITMPCKYVNNSTANDPSKIVTFQPNVSGYVQNSATSTTSPTLITIAPDTINATAVTPNVTGPAYYQPTIIFNATSASGPDNTNLNYSLDCGNGTVYANKTLAGLAPDQPITTTLAFPSSATGSTACSYFGIAGSNPTSYNVTLTISRGNATSTASAVVTVTDPVLSTNLGPAGPGQANNQNNDPSQTPNLQLNIPVDTLYNAPGYTRVFDYYCDENDATPALKLPENFQDYGNAGYALFSGCTYPNYTTTTLTYKPKVVVREVSTTLPSLSYTSSNTIIGSFIILPPNGGLSPYNFGVGNRTY